VRPTQWKGAVPMKTILVVAAVIASLFFIIDALLHASFIDIAVFAFITVILLMVVKAVRDAI
jgi:hypothetical protein